MTEIEIAVIIPKEPNQSSETNSTKSNLAGNNKPVIIPNTISDSNIPRKCRSPRSVYLHTIKNSE